MYWMPGTQQIKFIIPLLSWTENKTKMIKIRTGRDHSLITIAGKTDLAQGNFFNLLAIKSE